MNENNYKYKILYIISMIIFSTVAIFTHYINLPSGLIVLFRSTLGLLVLSFFLFVIKKDRLNLNDIKNNLLYLILGGMSLGLNWLSLFTAYTCTTVAMANLLNYIAPVIMILLSPLIFKEKLKLKKIICVIVSVIGMMFIVNIFNIDNINVMGVLLGLSSAACYVGIIIFNKLQKNIRVYDTVIIQLLVASLIVLPYVLFTTDFKSLSFDYLTVIFILVIGFVHTGIAYILYYGSMPHISAQSVSILCYIEPLLSIVLSVIILKESLDIYIIIGGILLLSSTLVSEINFKNIQKIK